MDVKIEISDTFPCWPNVFAINGVDAKVYDFGGTKTYFRHDICDCCNDFTPYEVPRENVFEKYQISKDEYDEICEMLQDKLCVRSCGWCSTIV